MSQMLIKLCVFLLVTLPFAGTLFALVQDERHSKHVARWLSTSPLPCNVKRPLEIVKSNVPLEGTAADSYFLSRLCHRGPFGEPQSTFQQPLDGLGAFPACAWGVPFAETPPPFWHVNTGMDRGFKTPRQGPPVVQPQYSTRSCKSYD